MKYAYTYDRGPIILFKVICTLTVAFGFVYSVNAQNQYNYVATTQAKAAAEQGPVQAGSQTWKCGGNECYTRGPSATLGIGDCKALAQKVGPLASYGHSGRWFAGKELDACNAGAQKTLPSPGVVQAPRGEIGEALPSPGVAKDKQRQIKETSLSTSAIQAPKGQLKEALPSPGVTQLPSDSLPSAALSPPAQIQLSQSELDSMARTLNTIGSQRYEYVLWRRTPTQSKRMKLSVVRLESIDGVLLNRDKTVMESLGGRYYDDRMGNLVLLGHLVDDTGGRFPYSFTATPWGEGIFGADRDNDGVIDLALGSHRGDGRLWMMANDHFKRLLQCIEESALSTAGNDMFNAASLCVPCLDPNREPGSALTSKEMGCVNKRGGSAGASLGGALNSDAMPGLLGEPECGRSTPGAGITSDDSEEALRGMQRFAQGAREAGYDAERPDIKRAWRRYARAMEEAADEYEAYIELAEEWGADDPGAKAHYEATEKALEEAGEAWGDLERLIVGSSYGDSLPPIGPDSLPQGDFADPRCWGNKTAMAQGTMWGDFCRNEDGSHIGMMECTRKMSDSIYAISGGRCWQESGPAGGERIVCRQEESGRGDDPAGGPGVAPGDSGATDDPRTDRLGRSSGAGGRYIDTTPMGGFLAGWCAQGGCPDVPPMDMDRKRE